MVDKVTLALVKSKTDAALREKSRSPLTLFRQNDEFQSLEETREKEKKKRENLQKDRNKQREMSREKYRKKYAASNKNKQIPKSDTNVEEFRNASYQLSQQQEEQPNKTAGCCCFL
eukprot:gene18793-20684_t